MQTLKRLNFVFNIVILVACMCSFYHNLRQNGNEIMVENQTHDNEINGMFGFTKTEMRS